MAGRGTAAVTVRGGSAPRRWALAAGTLAEAAAAGLAPALTGVMLHSAGLARRFADVPEASRTAAAWALAAGVGAGLCVAAGVDCARRIGAGWRSGW